MCSSLGRRRGFESAAEVPVRSDVRVEALVDFPRDHLCRMEHAIRTATQGNAEAKHNYFDKVFSGRRMRTICLSLETPSSRRRSSLSVLNRR
jgi:hypothetical protein